MKQKNPTTQKERSKIICLDFDGTIHSEQDWTDDNQPAGKPTEGAKEFVNSMLADGYEVIISSARINEADDTGAVVLGIVDWLDRYGFDYGIAVVPTKPAAHAYVDDRAIRFRGNWEAVKEAMLEPVWTDKGNEKEIKKPKEEELIRPPTIADLIRKQKEGREAMLAAIHSRAEKDKNE